MMYTEDQSILLETLNKAYREYTFRLFVRLLDESFNEKLGDDLKDTLKRVKYSFDQTKRHIEGLT